MSHPQPVLSEGCFGENYRAAREKFLSAAHAAGAEVRAYLLAERGPDGGELATDIAWLGPGEAARVLVTISGTHGVEGFFGSAAQVEWLRRAGTRSWPDDLAVAHVHAINPYGFAWLRRTNEQNIDVNRNWIDFDRPVPENPLYEELADELCPADWSADTQARTGQRLAEWIRQRGFPKFQQAVSGGQWRHPQGLFYGGSAPSWSRATLTDILRSRLGGATRVNIIDFHTGLGAYGYAEPIIGRRRSDAGFARTKAWIGAAAKSLYGDGSISAEIQGDAMSAVPGLVPKASVDVVALECGIRPIGEVAQALRADNWLHMHGDPRGSEAAAIKSMIRAAFHSDDPLWQGMALGQALAACEAAIAGLTTTAG
ncbi:MAG TPA: M14 family metallopeptidase [Steroidobacteraceae bacterium]|nr:M14 family metallopeptidase [Steroidobacteraceae bacterium]